jgi:hypothetical protein
MPAFYQPITVTASLTLDEDTHGGAWVNLNAAAGLTVTLPASAGKGTIYKLFVMTTVTSNNYVVQVANATDIMQGGIAMSTDISGTNLLTAATTDTITMNGSTTGGLKGTWLTFEDASPGIWVLSGFVVTTGTEASPFSAAVS